MKEGKFLEVLYIYNNVKKYVVFELVDNWVIVFIVEYNDYMLLFISIRNYIISISIIVIVIVMIFVYLYLLKGIIDFINKLEKLMKRVGDGDLIVKMIVNRNDEIGELESLFNNMIEY